MARCTHCHHGGAKRLCPALEGLVCPRCCAQHQRREIQCPDDCHFLRQGHSHGAYDRAATKLLDFTVGHEEWMRPALLSIAEPNRDVEEWEETLVLTYAACGYGGVAGERAIDAFLGERRGALRRDELETLEAMQQTAWPSLFEVQSVELDRGMHLHDLATGEDFFVREELATHTLTKFDVLLAWLAVFGDEVQAIGALVSVPRAHVDKVRSALEGEMGRLRKKHKGVAPRVLLREAVVSGHKALRRAFSEWQPPAMRTTHGEEIVFSEALFDVNDVGAAGAKLAAHPDMEADGEGYVWLDRASRPELDEDLVILGRIGFASGRRGRGAGRLKLETQSRERLERGKALLIDYLAGIARYRADSFQDFDVALAEYDKRNDKRAGGQAGGHPRQGSAGSAGGIPEDIQAQVIGPYMQQHIESWVDTALPALEGKTPRQAVKTKAGRSAVVSMLKDQENSMLRQPGGELVDFGVVYQELGLPR